jgi:hypothetical protein
VILLQLLLSNRHLFFHGNIDSFFSSSKIIEGIISETTTTDTITLLTTTRKRLQPNSKMKGIKQECDKQEFMPLRQTKMAVQTVINTSHLITN